MSKKTQKNSPAKRRAKIKNVLKGRPTRSSNYNHVSDTQKSKIIKKLPAISNKKFAKIRQVLSANWQPNLLIRLKKTVTSVIGFIIYLWQFFWGIDKDKKKPASKQTSNIAQFDQSQENAESQMASNETELSVQASQKSNTFWHPAIINLKNNFASKFPLINKVIIAILRIIFFPIINPFLRYGIILLFLMSLVGIAYYSKDLPSPRRLTAKENYAVSTQIFDRNKVLLYEIFADENRIPIKISDLPPHVYQASIAIEDKNFYKHFGFDIEGIVRAIRNNLRSERMEGGSTITQQLVKNALLTKEKSLQRKIKEAFLAVMTEMLYSKEEILEMYLNYISYGGTSVGIEAASNRYFDKHAKDLSLAESALLAGLPQAPSKYSPFGSDPKGAKNRQVEVLRRMLEDGYINPQQAESAKKQILEFALSRTEIKAPHFVFYVRDLLYEEYGEEQVRKGGLRVHTTLDLALQETLQASLSAEVNKIEQRYRVSNGAGMVVKPPTGEILAMIGSRDYFDATNEGQVNVTIAERQPGSSIKPLMYATAFQLKTLNPGTVLVDKPTCFNIPGQKPYCPKNYDGTFKGAVTVRRSLGNSLNIPAVKALKTIDVIPFIEQAKKMGITSWQDYSRYGLALTLGGGEVKMLDMAQAYATLANQGVKVPLTAILKIEDYRGKVLKAVDLEQRITDLNYLTVYDGESGYGELIRVMDRAPAYLASHIMQDDNARIEAFGRNSKLVIPGQVVSVKTGTTNNLKDNWTLGFTPEILAITWVGNNDGSPMSRVTSGVIGAAPIWHDFMQYLLKDREPAWPEKPNDVLMAGVCDNGMPPIASNNKCQVKYTEMYWAEGRPSNSRYVKQQVWIDPNTGQPPPAGQHVDGLVLEEKMLYLDPSETDQCKDCQTIDNIEEQIVY